MEYPFKIKRVSPALGALISGIDLSQELDEKQFTALNYALQAYHVLFLEINLYNLNSKNNLPNSLAYYTRIRFTLIRLNAKK